MWHEFCWKNNNKDTHRSVMPLLGDALALIEPMINYDKFEKEKTRISKWRDGLLQDRWSVCTSFRREHREHHTLHGNYIVRITMSMIVYTIFSDVFFSLSWPWNISSARTRWCQYIRLFRTLYPGPSWTTPCNQNKTPFGRDRTFCENKIVK